MALKKNKKNNNLSFLISKLLLSIIIILSSFIYVNWNSKNRTFFKKYVLDELFKSAIVIPFPLLIELRKLYFKI